MVGVFISGFSASSSGGNPGTHQMADDGTISGNIPGNKLKRKHTQKSKIVKDIQDALKADPCEPVVLVGHSLGGSTAIKVAKKLKKLGICVDLLIQIESKGIGDETLPERVVKGVNIWSTSRKGINGADNVDGSENIGIDDTTHTDIDENPTKEDGSDNPSVGQSSQSGYEGSNCWDLVRNFTSALPKKGCNCTT